MFEFETALRTIHALPLSQFISSSVWAYPLLEIFHLIGLGLLFGPIIIYDLSILGLIRSAKSETLAAVVLPCVWTGFAINATSGVLLFASDAVEFGSNNAFLVKIGLIFLAGLNALIFQFRANQQITLRPVEAGAPDTSVSLPTGARFQAGFSILLWISVLIAGRLIAYVA